MANGKIAIAEKDFYREFRSKIRDPLIKHLGESKAEPVIALTKALDTEIPTVVYSAIVRQEQSTHLSGPQKLLGAMGYFVNWLEGAGFGKFVPYLLPIIQQAVSIIFTDTVKSFIERYGLTKLVEALLGFLPFIPKATTPAGTNLPPTGSPTIPSTPAST